MTSGLESVEINLNEIKKNDTFRFDNEYFIREYIRLENSLSQSGYFTLANGTNEITDFGAYSQTNIIELKEAGVNFFRIQDIGKNTIDSYNCAKIEDIAYKQLTLHLQENDVIIPRVGTLGNAGVVKKEYLPASANQNLAVIRVKKQYSPYYFSTILSSRIGVMQINRMATGNVQPWLNLSGIANIKIPTASQNIQNAIDTVVLLAHSLISQSNSCYIAAKSSLLYALGMENFMPQSKLFAVKSLSESFTASGRLDAEYYQAKYDSLFSMLSGLPREKLGNIVEFEKSIEPGSEHYGDEGVPFIRVSDVTKYGISSTSINIPANLTKLRPKKDTILLSKDASVGIAYKVEQDMDVITSGALLHLTVGRKEVLPDYLTLVLNSLVVRLQAERDAGGSIIQHWKPSEIAEVVIPILSYNVQSKIAEQVQKSFVLRRQSEQLLEQAKRAVEIAIEQGENAAIAWLKEKGVEG